MTYRQVPNILTVLRLVLAAVFFIVLNQYRYDSGRSESLLLTAGVIFILAALTDAADGYLARRWHVESTFGRIMDPFCDKVLVIGAFIYLSAFRHARRGGRPLDIRDGQRRVPVDGGHHPRARAAGHRRAR